MNRATILLSLALAVTAPLLAGCFEDAAISLTYNRPARVVIPDRVKRIAMARFTGANVMDQRWADITADKLAAELGKWNQQFHRYELVDRNNLAQVLKEKDIQIMTNDQAVSAGKIAQVQAMLFGNVRVQGRDERRSRQQYDFVTKTNKTIWYTHRYVLVSVNLTMTDVDTSKAIYSDTISAAFDSDKDTEDAWLKAFGLGNDNPPPLDETINKKVDQAVAHFVMQVSPHRVVIKVRLEGGLSDSVTTGNKLAKAGDYAGALDVYKTAMQEKPNDDVAYFNAGLMNEALGNFPEADRLYLKAFQLGKKDKYIEARQRVRREGNGAHVSK